MPELPEVEVTRRSLAPNIEGATVQAVRLGAPLRWPLGCLPDALLGRTVLSVRRRGKYLLLDMDQGLLLLHLGMSGSLRFASALPEPGRHDHFDLVTSSGGLRLNDPRRFGAVVFAPSEASQAAQKLLGRLGVEPLENRDSGGGAGFDLKLFAQELKRRRAPIKQVLLAGEVVVGVGNIYACEALFWAGIRPMKRAEDLSLPRIKKLRQAIIDVLSKAVERGGSTLRNFSSASGERGHFQVETMVYGREGMACRVCNTPIQHLWQGQRSSFFCPKCQRS